MVRRIAKGLVVLDEAGQRLHYAPYQGELGADNLPEVLEGFALDQSTGIVATERCAALADNTQAREPLVNGPGFALFGLEQDNGLHRLSFQPDRAPMTALISCAPLPSG